MRLHRRPMRSTSIGVSAPASVSVFRGKDGYGVDRGLRQADARGGEVLIKMFGAGSAGDRERCGGTMQLPGQCDLLWHDVVVRSDRVDRRVERTSLGAAGNGGGVPGREYGAGL